MNNNSQFICPICSHIKATKGVRSEYKGQDYFLLECPRCGKVKISGDIIDDKLPQYNLKDRSVVSGYLREKFDNRGEVPELSYSNLDEVVEIGKNLSIQQMSEKIIFYLYSHASYFGEEIQFDSRDDYSIAYCQNTQEFGYLFDYLEQAGLVKLTGTLGSYIASLTVSGHEYVDSTNHQSSSKVFVAMSFSKNLLDAYTKGIKPAIEDMSYKPVRVDNVEHISKIDDLIIAEIKTSRFVVADFTENRPSVYFEAGYALALGKPVIWLCSEKDINSVHFDTRQYSHIVWDDNFESLRFKLKNRIEALGI